MSQGPGLVFVTVPAILPMGPVIGKIFGLLLPLVALAALTSSISLLEVVVCSLSMK